MDTVTEPYEIVSPEFTVDALRDSGYRDTAHALAELIDNSIEANASLVEVFIIERERQLAHRMGYRIDEIVVIDNGDGMDPDSLRRALKFGDGTRRERRGMGRFGMGLPNSSVSQCELTEVWSWTNGSANAVKSQLDLDEVRNGLREVPEPVHALLPADWSLHSEGLGNSGTLVRWTKLDRCSWSRGGTTLDKTEQLIGRIYRRFIEEGRSQIRFVTMRDNEQINECYVRPNDPLFLIKNTCTPAPFENTPMFEPALAGTSVIGEWTQMMSDSHGESHPVVIRASIAKDSARVEVRNPEWPSEHAGREPGSTPWGKRAMSNQGISVVRAGREIMLDTSWLNASEPTERWWGLEIEFPPKLDEVFGVTNNKQSANLFSSMVNFEVEDEALPNETFQQYKQRLLDDGDPRHEVITLVVTLKEILQQLRRRVRETRRGARSGGNETERHDERLKAITKRVTEERREDGHVSGTDLLDEAVTEGEKRRQQLENLHITHQLDESDAAAVVDADLEKHYNVRFQDSHQPDNPGFFGIEFLPGMLQINLNTAHPVHEKLTEVLEGETSNMGAEELRGRVLRARDALRLLIVAFARYEDEEPPGRSKDNIKEVRHAWGLLARRFLTEDV